MRLCIVIQRKLRHLSRESPNCSTQPRPLECYTQPLQPSDSTCPVLHISCNNFSHYFLQRPHSHHPHSHHSHCNHSLRCLPLSTRLSTHPTTTIYGLSTTTNKTKQQPARHARTPLPSSSLPLHLVVPHPHSSVMLAQRHTRKAHPSKTRGN